MDSNVRRGKTSRLTGRGQNERNFITFKTIYIYILYRINAVKYFARAHIICIIKRRRMRLNYDGDARVYNCTVHIYRHVYYTTDKSVSRRKWISPTKCPPPPVCVFLLILPRKRPLPDAAVAPMPNDRFRWPHVRFYIFLRRRAAATEQRLATTTIYTITANPPHVVFSRPIAVVASVHVPIVCRVRPLSFTTHPRRRPTLGEQLLIERVRQMPRV